MVSVTQDDTITPLNLKTLPSTNVKLNAVPEDGVTFLRDIPASSLSVTGLDYSDGTLYVTGDATSAAQAEPVRVADSAGKFASAANPAAKSEQPKPVAVSSPRPEANDTGDSSSARVEEVYPSADELPENLLRFFIYFSAPMGSGGIHESFELLDGEGRPVPGVFLDSRYELWSPDRRRLTLLLDPGRVKTGLKAHNRLGRALIVGEEYRLRVVGPDDKAVPGRIELSDSESTWRFSPRKPWWAGADCRLVVGHQLENLAGNRLCGLFDRKIESDSTDSKPAEQYVVNFYPQDDSSSATGKPLTKNAKTNNQNRKRITNE